MKNLVSAVNYTENVKPAKPNFKLKMSTGMCANFMELLKQTIILLPMNVLLSINEQYDILYMPHCV